MKVEGSVQKAVEGVRAADEAKDNGDANENPNGGECGGGALLGGAAKGYGTKGYVSIKYVVEFPFYFILARPHLFSAHFPSSAIVQINNACPPSIVSMTPAKG